LEKLNELEPSKANLITQEFITDFVTTLSRLVGKQLASELAAFYVTMDRDMPLRKLTKS